jgi:nucleotide-binding universal stress UspA family protein
MSIKSILAAYSGEAESCGALNLALLMTRKYDASLTGVVWHGASVLESRYRAYMTRDIIKMMHERDAETVAAIHAEFDEHVARSGAPREAEFLDISGDDGSLADLARTYDVIVMARAAAEAGREHFAARPDVVALRSGRPVIVAPADFDRERLNEHALIAWDGKRAAARALGDAMHILETKERVTVLTVNDAASPDPVMRLLERHGIKAQALAKRAGREGIGKTIVDACNETDAGLLVMGAYEHSKFSEDVLGGVTRDILDGAPLPVLMSH